ncbi:MAG: 4Fe-4S dicluster domain-containing protein [Chloroflexi bacterium]|nr:4Fe-4S dicluster domain-containing protein [Chloroflexota bacterium]
MTKGTIFIDQEKCKGCSLCTAVCPQEVIVMQDDRLNLKGYHPASLNEANAHCTGCGVCAVICPDVCITVYREPQMKSHATTAC